MLKVTLFVQREMKNQDTDDIIRVYSDSYPDLFRVVYSAPDMRKSVQFRMTRIEVVNYISSILKSLNDDALPFEFVQVATAIHPTILYPVDAVEDRATRYSIEDMVNSAMKTTTVRV